VIDILCAPFRRISFPVSQFRFFTAVVTAIAFSFLLYLASTRLSGFTSVHGIFALFGLGIGLLLGLLEAKIVTRGLTDKTQTVAWQIIPWALLLLGMPILVAKLFMADVEFVAFTACLLFPAVPVFSAVSGWSYQKFESKNAVQIKMVSFGYLYHKEPLVVDSNRLYHFLRAVELKDSTTLWQQTGYTGRLTKALRQKHDIDPSQKERLFDILKVMNKYRFIGLTALLLFCLSMASVAGFIYFPDFFNVTRNNDLAFHIVAQVLVSLASLGITVIVMTKMFNSKISELTAHLNSETTT